MLVRVNRTIRACTMWPSSRPMPSRIGANVVPGQAFR